MAGNDKPRRRCGRQGLHVIQGSVLQGRRVSSFRRVLAGVALRPAVHAVQILKGLLEARHEGFFAFAQPHAWVIVLFIGRVGPAGVANLTLQESFVFHVVILDAFPQGPLQVGVDVHLDCPVANGFADFGTGPSPINFVFHGGSGSSQAEIREAIGYGAIKMNIDTDLQWALWEGIKDYYVKNEGFLQGQIGNPGGADSPNKKYYDPRVWLRKGEETFVARLKQAFEDLNCVNRRP